jgi:hypothetical protein
LLTAPGACAVSTETHVFFRGKLPTPAALSRTMKELGFPFSITPSTGSLEQRSGFVPMMMRGEETGVEFDVYSGHAAVEEFADVGVDEIERRRAGGDRYSENWFARQEGLLARDVASLCADLRSRESEVASRLQLGGAWESARLPSKCPRKNERGRPTNRCF